MTEATVTQALHKVLKLQLPGGDVYKVSDRITKGRPDTVITWHHFTTWVEVKLLKRGDTFGECARGDDALQHYTMTQLWEQSGHRAWYVVYDVRKPRQRDLIICTPDALLKLDRSNPLPYGGGPSALDLLARGGAVGIQGFAHGVVGSLIIDTHRSAYV